MIFKVFYFWEYYATELLMALQEDSDRANGYSYSIGIKAQPTLTNELIFVHRVHHVVSSGIH